MLDLHDEDGSLHREDAGEVERDVLPAGEAVDDRPGGRAFRSPQPERAPGGAENTKAPRESSRGAWCSGDSFSAPDRIRTCDLCLRRATLYPAELRAQNVGRRCKPSSVPRRSGGGSFLWDRRCRRPLAAYPGFHRGGQPLIPYLALLRVGFTMPPLLPGARCALTATVSPLPVPRRPEPSAVCSLLHCPSPRDARPLAGTLPCGARTFLDTRRRRDPHSSPELSNIEVPRRGLEPPRRFRHQILSLACLPISAPGQTDQPNREQCSGEDSNLHGLTPTRS